MSEITEFIDESFEREKKTSGRRRAKIACLSCRRRKVRCDVHPRGSPCTNCRLDRIECNLRERKRVYSARRGRDAQQRVEKNHDVDRSESLQERHPGDGSSDSSSPRSDPDASPGARRLDPSRMSPLRERNVPAASSATPASTSLPYFLHCRLDHLSSYELDDLRGKGCFSLPQKAVMNALLNCYFDFIHPHLPMLDEQELWEMYLAEGPEENRLYHTASHRMSLILFQAILFAATTCAPIEVLRRAGFNSRSVARKAMFAKVRALYAMELEQDRMILFQTLLLMSYWNDDPGQDEGAWYWSGLAVSLAFELGLQRESLCGLGERQKTFRKRCWWSCIVRERLIALSEQRTPRVFSNDGDIPPLTLADYNVGLRSKLSSLSAGEELGKRVALSMFSIQLIRLFLNIDRGRHFPEGTAESPQCAEETWARCKPARQEQSSRPELGMLNHWKLNLPEVLQRSTGPEADDSVLLSILVHKNALHIYFRRILSSICISRLQASDSDIQEVTLNHDIVAESSQVLVRLRDELMDHDALHFLPRECLEMTYQGADTLTKSTMRLNKNERDSLRPRIEARKGEAEQTKATGSTMGDLGDWHIAYSIGSYEEPFVDIPGLSADGSSIGTSQDMALSPSELLSFDALMMGGMLEPLKE
ncbi:uncharacterized protein E0L32_005823 [Thyridium curvatum]|uniref:Zn(2)-C6 fungal-type domain-containing protein n=1 Tax=Thyridium curvatum TaxID=1093900 RepID=A0A507B908_9PEZI|nr:uncharacterized protein E0L32_005823 [Thyridium curvatum]TPX13879.1 hypothetical protein E0L32_005823 [Thyridium curvatum]